MGTATAPTPSVKQHAATLTQDLRRFAGEQYDKSERVVRDFLFLVTPQTVLKRQRETVDEIQAWYDTGTFCLDKQTYPFTPRLLREALQQMWHQPSFAPDGRSATRSLNYLKRVMLGCLRQTQQRRQAAGIQETVDRRQEAGGREQAVGGRGQEIAEWCRELLGQVETLPFDAPISRKVVSYYAGEPERAPENLRALVAQHLRDDTTFARRAELDALREDIRQECHDYSRVWDARTLQDTIEATLWQRAQERYGLPLLVVEEPEETHANEPDTP